MFAMKKGQLRTNPTFSELSTTYNEEIDNPNRGISSVLAEPISEETAAQEQEEDRKNSRAPRTVKYRGKYYRITPKGRRIADLYLKKYSGKEDIVRAGLQFGSAPAVVPYSLRQFLREHQFPDSSRQYETMIDDNDTAHALDMSRSGAAKRFRQRRSSLVFAPGVYEQMIAHLNGSGDVFQPGSSREPGVVEERSGHFLGVKHIDPESGVPWIHVTHAVTDPEGYSDTESAKSLSHMALERMQHEFEANPMLYVVGTAHSHPSGGTALPSDADIRNIQNLFGSNGHSSFDLIHAPGAIVSREGEILHGPAADAYLRAHAQESVGQWVVGAGGRRQKNITPTGPRTITPYGQSVGALQSKPEERIGRLGVGQSVTNIYNAITGGFDTEQYPTTHGWLGAKGESGRTKILHPSMVTLLSAHGGAAEPPNTIGVHTPYPLDLSGLSYRSTMHSEKNLREGRHALYPEAAAQPVTQFATTKDDLELSLIKQRMQILQKALRVQTRKGGRVVN